MVMTLRRAIEILELHNQWRRGAEIPQQSPELLGIAIDTILTHLKTQNNE
jgi:hypothetical protein